MELLRTPRAPQRHDPMPRTERSMRGQKFADDFLLVEWHLRRSPNLICLVALSSEEHDVSVSGVIECASNRFATVLDSLVTPGRHSGFDVVENFCRIFSSRIIAGRDHNVGVALCRRAQL